MGLRDLTSSATGPHTSLMILALCPTTMPPCLRYQTHISHAPGLMTVTATGPQQCQV